MSCVEKAKSKAAWTLVGAAAGVVIAFGPKLAQAQSFLGDTVNASYIYPTPGTVLNNGGNQLVAPLASFTFYGNTFQVTATQYTVSGPVGFLGNVAYNGVRITDLSNSLIVGATINGATTKAGFDASRLSFTSNSVSANLAGLPGGGLVVIDVQFAFPIFTLTAPNLLPLAQTANQLSAALGLTNAFNATNLGTPAAPNGVAGAIANALNNTPAGAIPAVLDSLTGEGITAAQNTAFTASRLFTSSISDQTLLFGGAPNSVIVPTSPAVAPLAYSAVQALPTPIRVRDPLLSRPLYSWRAWGAGYGASQRINANPVLGNAQQSIGIGGGSVGVDYTYAPGMLSGIALGGSDGSFNVGSRQTSGSTTGGHAAFYTLAEFGNVYAASISSVSVFGNRTTRTVAGFGGLNSEILRGNFTSTESAPAPSSATASTSRWA